MDKCSFEEAYKKYGDCKGKGGGEYLRAKRIWNASHDRCAELCDHEYNVESGHAPTGIYKDRIIERIKNDKVKL